MPRRRPTPQLSADLRQTTHARPSEVGGGITSTFAAAIRPRQFFLTKARQRRARGQQRSTVPLDRGNRSHVQSIKCAPLQTEMIGAWFAQGEATMTKLLGSLGLGA